MSQLGVRGGLGGWDPMLTSQLLTITKSHLLEKLKQVTVDDNPAGIRWIKLVI